LTILLLSAVYRTACDHESPRRDRQFSPHRHGFQVSRLAMHVYAASSWWGYTRPDDRKRLQAIIRRGIRSGLCEQCHKIVDEIVEDADEKLFSNIIYNKLHVLNLIGLLPDTRH